MQVGRLIGKKLGREKKFKKNCMKRGPTTPKKFRYIPNKPTKFEKFECLINYHL
jgi:hypothetical protein